MTARLNVLAILLALYTCPAVCTRAADDRAVPVGHAINTTNLTAGVRTAIAAGVHYLRTQCRTGDQGLPVLPANRSRVSKSASGPDRWGEGFIGNNALVLHAMLKMGVPADDPIAKALANRLRALVTTYGIPDTTWDVAWLAAALAGLPEDEPTPLREQVFSKLMDGQVSEGPARGMWGPLCINARLLAKVDQLIATLSKRIATAEKAGRTIDASWPPLLESLRLFRQQAARQGERGDRMTRTFEIEPTGHRAAMIQGLPYDFRAQTFADQEMTTYALYALSEGRRAGVLPTGTQRPTAGHRPLVPAIKPDFVLEQAAGSIVGSQRPDGMWDTRNVHQACNAFGAAADPLPKELFFKLEQTADMTTTARALCGLLDALAASGPNGRLNPKSYEKEMTQAFTVLQDGLDAYVGATDVLLPNGKSTTPWELFFCLRRLHYAPGSVEETARDLWNRLAWRAVVAQNADGSWGEGRPPRRDDATAWHPQASTSFRAWRAAFDARRRALPQSERRKLDISALDLYRTQEWLGADHAALRPVATAFAMLFLAEGAHAPVAGYLRVETMRSAPPTLAKAIDILAKETGTPLTFARLPVPPTDAQLADLPVLVISGTDALKHPEARAAILDYIARKGMLVVEIYPKMGRVAQEQAVRELIRSSRIRALGRDATFMDAFQGTRPAVAGVYTTQNQLFAVLLPLSSSATPERGAMALPKAVQTLYLLVKDRMDAAVTSGNYLLGAEDASGALKAREEAVKKLTGE